MEEDGGPQGCKFRRIGEKDLRSLLPIPEVRQVIGTGRGFDLKWKVERMEFYSWVLDPGYEALKLLFYFSGRVYDGLWSTGIRVHRL